MLIKKSIENPSNYTTSTHWKVWEYTHWIADNTISLVVHGYASEKAMEAWKINETRVYNLDTIKKYRKDKIMEEVEIPEVTQDIPASLDEEWNELSPAQTIVTTPARTEEQRTWEYEEVWTNEDKFIDVSDLTNVILPFIYGWLVANGDLESWELINE